LNSVEYFKTAIYLAASEQVSKSKAILKFQNIQSSHVSTFSKRKKFHYLWNSLAGLLRQKRVSDLTVITLVTLFRCKIKMNCKTFNKTLCELHLSVWKNTEKKLADCFHWNKIQKNIRTLFEQKFRSSLH